MSSKKSAQKIPVVVKSRPAKKVSKTPDAAAAKKGKGKVDGAFNSVVISTANLVCPIRGELSATYFAKDGMTVSEEARRIECINFLLGKNYPPENFDCETVVLKRIGNAGRNSLRADIVIYDCPKLDVDDLDEGEKFKRAMLVAEIKRENKSKRGAVTFQLEPALKQIDRSSVFGVYWDDINRHLYVKSVSNDEVKISKDELGNIPDFGNEYRYKKLKYENLIKPEDISATLMDIANTLRSNHINDEAVRYRETVKLLLAKYIDEREAKENGEDLILQVVPGRDVDFKTRVGALYKRTARIYSKAKSIFNQETIALEDKALREVVQKIQGLNLLDSSSDSMQQVFMTFVPAVFKKDLDQYFTPLTLVSCMVEVLKPGPNDKIADPAMGTADFLTATMQYRLQRNDGQIINRVYGADKDKQAYELAVINMILNKDGQTNLHNIDSIEEHDRWAGQMDIALCNPPFGSKTIETRKSVLKHYDLGHEWLCRDGVWKKTDTVLESQQLGILFIERCFKLLADGGRMGIILPEGYLCTPSYGYVRQWIVDNFTIIGLVELPRRIFLKSEADLRSNILFAEKTKNEDVDYPVHAELVRKVGYKLGKGFFTIPLRDSQTEEDFFSLKC
jgi:type I restriction enzyme M protein